MAASNPLVGSMHINSDGYGRGVRCLTSRNIPTWPASVPLRRHPPDTERFLSGTRPTPGPCVLKDDKSLKRNADQMMLQTSGEYGKFLFDTKSSAATLRTGRLNSRSSEASAHVLRCDSGRTSEHQNIVSTREPSTSQNDRQLVVNSKLSSRRCSPPRAELTARSALKQLDAAFSRKNRRDLVAATMPLRSDHELILSATSGNLAQLQSKPWAEKLRLSQR